MPWREGGGRVLRSEAYSGHVRRVAGHDGKASCHGCGVTREEEAFGTPVRPMCRVPGGGDSDMEP